MANTGRVEVADWPSSAPGTLAQDFLVTDVDAVLEAGQGARFPAVRQPITIGDGLTGPYAVYDCGSRAGDTLQDLEFVHGTQQLWPAGTPVEGGPPAWLLNRYQQPEDPPALHAASHATGEADELTPQAIDALGYGESMFMFQPLDTSWGDFYIELAVELDLTNVGDPPYAAPTVDGVTVTSGCYVLALAQTNPADRSVWYWDENGGWQQGLYDPDTYRGTVYSANAGTNAATQIYVQTRAGTPYVDPGEWTLLTDVLGAMPRIPLTLAALAAGSPSIRGQWTFHIAPIIRAGLIADSYTARVAADPPGGLAYQLTLGGIRRTPAGVVSLDRNQDGGAIIKGDAAGQYVELGAPAQLFRRPSRSISNVNAAWATTDYRLAWITLTAPRTGTLPALSGVSEGHRCIAIDASGNAGTHNITIQRTGSDLFADGTTNKKLASARAVLEVEKVNGKWQPIYQLGTIT